ncbi:sensor domain-containing diguanylate cyclase [Paludibacterium yongneupense]|uniref:sensor domain-containing diguanylate cyclase n=1 Tax=Paludibacterium yongneupense TaxID=400061 RepID=UPI000423C37A|nr:sensor domain-containing diguanylate cyclase [Paludibacterium yongneupense]
MLHTKLRAVSEGQARLESLRRMLMLGGPKEEDFLRATRLASHLFNAPIAYVSIIDGQSQVMMSPMGMRPQTLPREQSMCQQVVELGSLILCQDARADARFSGAYNVVNPPYVRSYMGQPVRNAEGHLIGVLCVADPAANRFSEEDGKLLVDLAFLLEATIALRYLSFSHEQALNLASRAGEAALTDALTGVLNRRGILDMANHAYARCRHENRSFSLALLDLDHFKQINDSHGHLAGDAVLKEAARRLQGALRTGDIVGRWGGEEFLVVFPGLAPEMLQDVGAKLVHAVTGEVAWQGETLPLSASAGLVGVSHLHDVFNEETLLDAADQALYLAKERGRGRAVVYPGV